MTRENARPALALLLAIAGAASLQGQDPREAQVARAFREFDPAARQQLLTDALNPTAGPLLGAWPVGVQLLAQTLLEDGKDSTAAAWLRWAIRLSPDLQPDTVLFLPELVAVYRSAQAFVASTRGGADSVAKTTWVWPTQTNRDQPGRLQIAASGLVPAGVEVRGVGPVAAGGSVPLNPGSYEISAVASGDTVRVTREVLPGVTTALLIPFRSAAAEVVPKTSKKGFPVIWVGLGAAGAAAVVAFLVAGANAPPAETGGIIVTFPNP